MPDHPPERALPTLVICGPTAGGKSALAVDLALLLAARGVPAEVLAADAFQVYRAMDIGTAKPTPDERRGVPHGLIDLVEPEERFTASDWLARAHAEIARVRGAGGVPVVVGGTHLYVKLLVEGMFEGPGQDEALRQRLRARGLPDLRAELERVDPAAAARIHPNDERRTVRALEVFHLTGTPISAHQRQWRETRGDDASEAGAVNEPHEAGDAGGVGARASESALGSTLAPTLVVGLEWPIEAINRRINARVKQMVERGLVDEARALWHARRLGPQSREALGYKQLIEHFEGRRTVEDAIEKIKIETRRFAKNQRTWLKRLRLTPGSLWIDAGATAPETWAGLVLERVLSRVS